VQGKPPSVPLLEQAATEVALPVAVDVEVPVAVEVPVDVDVPTGCVPVPVVAGAVAVDDAGPPS
jgi:hypothetical protein